MVGVGEIGVAEFGFEGGDEIRILNEDALFDSFHEADQGRVVAALSGSCAVLFNHGQGEPQEDMKGRGQRAAELGVAQEQGAKRRQARARVSILRLQAPCCELPETTLAARMRVEIRIRR